MTNCTDALEYYERKAKRQKKDRLQDLIDKMQFKAENIKAKYEPSVFIDVVNALKELQEYRRDKIYTEDDL